MSSEKIKAIVVLKDSQSLKLYEIAKYLQCSNLRALQYCISYVYGIESSTGRFWGNPNKSAKNMYIPFSKEQFRIKNMISEKEMKPFVTMCNISINNVHSLISTSELDVMHPSYIKYLSE